MPVKTQKKSSYELTLILKPDLSEVNLNKVLDQVESTIKNFGGDILSKTEPFLKRFTHRIKTITEGFYISILFSSPHDVPNTLKKSLSVSDDVLRYIILKKESVR